MKVCSQCGTANNDSAKFCKGCGNNVEAAQPVAQPVQPVSQAQPMAQPMQQPVHMAQPVFANSQPAQQYASQPAQPQPTQPMQPVSQHQAQPMFVQQNPQMAHPTQPTQPAQPMMQQAPAMQGAPHYTQPTNQLNSEQMMNFFHWLISAIKKPSQQYHVSSLYAVLVFVISALVSAIQTYCTVQSGANVFNSFTNAGANFLSSMLERSISAPRVSVPISVFIAAFFAAMISVYMTFVVALIGAKMFGDPMSASQLHVQFAQKMVPIVTIQICAALLGILTLSTPSVFLQIFAGFLTLLLPFSFVSHAECTRKMDREWLWVIYVLVAAIILIIVFLVTMGIVTSAISSAMYGALLH